MASKKDKKKNSTGTRNPLRKNGKAFSMKKFDTKGRALTGRGKPSGRSSKGMRADDYEKELFQLFRSNTIDLTRVKAA